MLHRTWPLALIALLVAATVFISPFFLPDDALFYPQVAVHIVGDHWSTFNGITSTNGYHPLWMCFSVLAALLAECVKLKTLYFVLAFQLALLLGVIWSYRTLARVEGFADEPGSAVLVLFFATGFWRDGIPRLGLLRTSCDKAVTRRL